MSEMPFTKFKEVILPVAIAVKGCGYKHHMISRFKHKRKFRRVLWINQQTQWAFIPMVIDNNTNRIKFPNNTEGHTYRKDQMGKTYGFVEDIEYICLMGKGTTPDILDPGASVPTLCIYKLFEISRCGVYTP